MFVSVIVALNLYLSTEVARHAYGRTDGQAKGRPLTDGLTLILNVLDSSWFFFTAMGHKTKVEHFWLYNTGTRNYNCRKPMPVSCFGWLYLPDRRIKIHYNNTRRKTKLLETFSLNYQWASVWRLCQTCSGMQMQIIPAGYKLSFHIFFIMKTRTQSWFWWT